MIKISSGKQRIQGLDSAFQTWFIGTRDFLYIRVRNIQDDQSPTNLSHSSREEPLELVFIPRNSSGLELQRWTHVWRGFPLGFLCIFMYVLLTGRFHVHLQRLLAHLCHWSG